MQPVVFALALSVIVSVGVLVAVALPHLRGGAPVLTRGGWQLAWRVLSAVQRLTRRFSGHRAHEQDRVPYPGASTQGRRDTVGQGPLPALVPGSWDDAPAQRAEQYAAGRQYAPSPQHGPSQQYAAPQQYGSAQKYAAPQQYGSAQPYRSAQKYAQPPGSTQQSGSVQRNGAAQHNGSPQASDGRPPADPAAPSGG